MHLTRFIGWSITSLFLERLKWFLSNYIANEFIFFFYWSFYYHSQMVFFMKIGKLMTEIWLILYLQLGLLNFSHGKPKYQYRFFSVLTWFSLDCSNNILDFVSFIINFFYKKYNLIRVNFVSLIQNRSNGS